MISMFRFLAIVIGAGAIGVFILVKLFGGEGGPAYVPAPINLAPRVVDTSWKDQRAETDQKIRTGVEARFAGAPKDVIELAVKIANPDILLNSYTDDILSLTRDEASRGYGQPYPDTAPDYVHTLLREAVINGNTGAAALLLDRGADVRYNDNEMALQSVNMEAAQGDYEYWFPDYAIGSKFLRMWLDRGGDPNITHPLYGGGLGGLLHHTPKANLEGTVSLLTFGADPWSPIAVKSDNGDILYEMPGYFSSLATGNRQYSEIAFRLALIGFYENGPEEDIDTLVEAIEGTSLRLNEMSGRNAANTKWAFQRALQEIFPAISRTPGPNARDLMSTRHPDDIGGFFLSEGQFRSPKTSDQHVVDRDLQVGRHLWR